MGDSRKVTRFDEADDNVGGDHIVQLAIAGAKMNLGRIVLTALLSGMAASTAIATNPGSALAAPCRGWTTSTVASGLGTLENLAFDGRGAMLLSSQSLSGPGGSIVRLTPTGKRTTLVRNIDGPGGIVVDGRTAYFNVGNSASSLFSSTGAIRAVNLDTHAVSTVATRLTMPNGLARLSEGSFVVSRDLGPDATLTRIARNGVATRYAPSVTSTNGLAFDAQRQTLYVSTTFNPRSEIAAIDVHHPSRTPRRYVIPGVGPLNSADDITVGPDGRVYVALNAVGRVAALDPVTGRSCTITDRVPLASSVRFGNGAGWDRKSLYATSFLGTVTRITPSAR